MLPRENRTRWVYVRVTPSELELLSEAAGEERVATFCRTAMLAVARTWVAGSRLPATDMGPSIRLSV